MKKSLYLLPILILALTGIYYVTVDAAEEPEPRKTLNPATEAPNAVVLTWSGDPTTTQTVQWRAAESVADGWVQLRPADAPVDATSEIEAAHFLVEDPLISNDPVNSRFEATLENLKPDTKYTYRVGSKEKDLWSEWNDFETAPAATEPFTFVYMGDAQVGYDAWGIMLNAAADRHPDAAFYLMAGDLINNGERREQYDALLLAAEGVFDERPLVPALGNHDVPDEGEPFFYPLMFDLPDNGPDTMPDEHAYSFQYSNAFFVVLNSDITPTAQTAWLEEQLKSSDATWKFAMYHHPAYSSRAVRDNKEVREEWGALFDKYHLDIAFQGHDHAYLRTYPMRGGKNVEHAAEGTYYIVSNAGSKHYEQDPRPYTERGFTDIATYQVIEINTNPDRLTYRAFDAAGNVMDEFTIEK